VTKHYLLQFFRWEHLTTSELQNVSKRFGELAQHLCTNGVASSRAELRKLVVWTETDLPVNPEATWAQTKLIDAEILLDDLYRFDEALRKVLEAKDCAVRALMFKADG
jgi:hypothetical protein